MQTESKIRILFQGDSITDACRSRDYEFYLGSGYPAVVSGALGLRNPGKYQFINRGVSGDRVVDLYARWKRDCLNWAPDVLSILVGVNDVWHEVDFANGVDAVKYERVFDAMVEEVKEQLPATRLIILEPFVLKGPATSKRWDYFSTEVPLRAAAAERVAEKYAAAFVPLQHLFDEACVGGVEPTEWLADGVHPTAAGHALIAREWLRAFDEM